MAPYEGLGAPMTGLLSSQFSPELTQLDGVEKANNFETQKLLQKGVWSRSCEYASSQQVLPLFLPIILTTVTRVLRCFTADQLQGGCPPSTDSGPPKRRRRWCWGHMFGGFRLAVPNIPSGLQLEASKKVSVPKIPNCSFTHGLSVFFSWDTNPRLFVYALLRLRNRPPCLNTFFSVLFGLLLGRLLALFLCLFLRLFHGRPQNMYWG